MKGLLFVAISGLLLQSGVFAASYPCDPEADCLNAANAAAPFCAMVPDPKNCTNYYVCVSDASGNLIPTPSPFPCPSGEYFELTLQACVTGPCDPIYVCPTAVELENVCRTSCPPATTLLAATHTRSINELFLMKEEFLEGSPRTTTTVADVNDCSSYIVCVDAVPVGTGTCPSEIPYYNGVACVADQSQCCNICQPYCWEVDTLIEDPADCTSYYYCMAEGAADTQPHASCPSGQYFEPSTYMCVAGTCSNICSSSTSGGPATTTITAAASTFTTAAASTFTTATATTTTTATATTTAGCESLSTFTCPNATGIFARCPCCDDTYFQCVNNVATIQNCPMTEVFNPVSSYPYCIPYAECPHYP